MWCIIEGKAFSPSYDLPPPPSVSSTGDAQEDWERDTCKQEGGGEEGKYPNHTKPGPLQYIKYTLVIIHAYTVLDVQYKYT